MKDSQLPALVTLSELRERMRPFIAANDPEPRSLDETKVPTELRPLLPYACIWGVTDDTTRGEMIERTPDDVREQMLKAIREREGAMLAWLGGPEARGPEYSAEYLAFSALLRISDDLL
jgi:hypothetical protein